MLGKPLIQQAQEMRQPRGRRHLQPPHHILLVDPPADPPEQAQSRIAQASAHRPFREFPDAERRRRLTVPATVEPLLLRGRDHAPADHHSRCRVAEHSVDPTDPHTGPPPPSPPGPRPRRGTRPGLLDAVRIPRTADLKLGGAARPVAIGLLPAPVGACTVCHQLERVIRTSSGVPEPRQAMEASQESASWLRRRPWSPGR
jgi:hypothetical protein